MKPAALKESYDERGLPKLYQHTSMTNISANTTSKSGLFPDLSNLHITLRMDNKLNQLAIFTLQIRYKYNNCHQLHTTYDIHYSHTSYTISQHSHPNDTFLAIILEQHIHGSMMSKDIKKTLLQRLNNLTSIVSN